MDSHDVCIFPYSGVHTFSCCSGNSFLKSRNEKLFFRSTFAFFLYALLITIYIASDLSYPIIGLISLLGTVLVGILFYVSARDNIIDAKVVFYFFVFSAAFVALPLLLVNMDTNGFAQLSESFGANSILYGYENPRAVGWASAIFLSFFWRLMYLLYPTRAEFTQSF